MENILVHHKKSSPGHQIVFGQCYKDILLFAIFEYIYVNKYP